ncbi:MAG TPA: HlyD family efflux transporter periplasmic adaptor subunit [Methylomirabilota bacterium]|jgi:multidrug efflux pump subunit AcrA (membrane-fusion protein)
MADRWTDPAPPFLGGSPAPWAARGLAWLLLALFAAAVVAAAIIRVPESVSARFVLVPERGADQLRASRDGTLAEIRAVVAQPVERGQVLFVLRSTVIGDRSAELRTLETQTQGAADRLANERRRHDSQQRADEEEQARLRTRAAHLTQKIDEQAALRATARARYRDTLAIYENDIEIGRREIEFKQQAFGVARELADRTERYHKEGIISWLEYNTRRLEAAKVAAELEQLDRQIDTARLKVSQLKSEEEQREIESRLTLDQLTSERREVQAALDKLGHEMAARRSAFVELERSLREDTQKSAIRIAALRVTLEQSQGNELSVPAPCAGVILRLAVQRAGAVVKEGEPLADLACGGSRLQAELTVPPAGVGQVKPGHPVKLLYDTFPYQRHGVRRATVRWVSPATVGADFLAFADIEDEAIVSQGERRLLTAGMGGRADVVVGRRSLIAYAFEPLRQLRESLADAPPKAGELGRP